jgi:pimeloyl-ACP methyl ester carboxylesterase
VGADGAQARQNRRAVARAEIDGTTLEYEDSGAGEPVVFVHGAFVADAFRPLIAEPALAERFRLITYHRRGHGGSGPVEGPVTIEDGARDCLALLSFLDVPRAHVVGHSYGANVALQTALEAPDVVRTLALLEAGLFVGESAPLYREALRQGRERFRAVGARTAVDEFMSMRWPAYRAQLDRVVPGALEQAVADAATFFESDLPGGLEWQFGEAEARRIAQPTLVVLGEESVTLHPRFAETHRLLLEWLPHAEGFVLPGATHFLQMERPRPLAEALAAFLAEQSDG